MTEKEKEMRREEIYRKGRELFLEKERLVQEYKKTHDTSHMFGIIDTPEIRTIQEKEKQLYKELCELRDL